MASAVELLKSVGYAYRWLVMVCIMEEIPLRKYWLVIFMDGRYLMILLPLARNG